MYSPAYMESSLSPLATRSRESRGRSVEEKECDLRTVFQRDRDRIIHSKSFRRLKHKAQVFIAPKGDHFRTRLTHTLEVMQIARTIARVLRLNEDLTEAIALGHDLGHTPFGHAGERSLRLIDADFSHNRQSLRVADVLERNGRGLNLTFEVKDGILHHSGDDGLPETFEGAVVRISDRIAYINHDIDDALRAGIISMTDLPKDALSILGETHGERIDTLVRDMARYGLDNGEAGMTEPVAEAMDALRRFLFDAVYKRPAAFADEERVREMLGCLYRYYSEHPGEMIMDYTDPNLHRAVCDYISGMTDIYALNRYEFIKNDP